MHKIHLDKNSFFLTYIFKKNLQSIIGEAIEQTRIMLILRIKYWGIVYTEMSHWNMMWRAFCCLFPSKHIHKLYRDDWWCMQTMRIILHNSIITKCDAK